MVTEVAVRKLDVGAGAKGEGEWVTMDISPVFSPDFEHDITQTPWPFDDGEFDEIRCWHVLEHIDRKHLIKVMNEMWRVLKDGGEVEIEVPVFPYWTAIADPTHVSFFVPQTFWYFTRAEYEEQRQAYGCRKWELVSGKKTGMGEIINVVLRK